MLASALDALEAPDAKTIVLKMKTPFPLVLQTLGKPNALVPFMMPEKLASTPISSTPEGGGRLRPVHPAQGSLAHRRHHGAGAQPRLCAARRAARFPRRRQEGECGPADLEGDPGPRDRRERAHRGRDRLSAIRALRPDPAAAEGERHQGDGAWRHRPVPGQFPPEFRRAALQRPRCAARPLEACRPADDAPGDGSARRLLPAELPVLLDVRNAV